MESVSVIFDPASHGDPFEHSREALKGVLRVISASLRCPIIILVTITDDRPNAFMGLGIDVTTLERDSPFFRGSERETEYWLVRDTLTDPILRCDRLVAEHPRIRSSLVIPFGDRHVDTFGFICALSPLPSNFEPQVAIQVTELIKLTEQLVGSSCKATNDHSATTEARPNYELYSEAEEATGMGFWQINLAQNSVRLSPQSSRLLGLDASPQITPVATARLFTPGDLRALRNAVMRAYTDQIPFNLDVALRGNRHQGRRVRVIGNASKGSQSHSRMSGVIFDITEDHLKQNALLHAAERDCLTGLYNRAAFDKHLTEALAKPCRLPVTVALIDLDGFKQVNDLLGHVLGDRVLVAISDCLRRESQSLPSVARWGGDEFALLFPANTTSEIALGFVSQLLKELNTLTVIGNDAPLGASCGIVQVNEPIANEEAMRRADLALYDAKGAGRGHASVWGPKVETAFLAKKTSVVQLQAALDQSRTFPVYQPIIDLQSANPVAVEALLRLSDQAGAIILAEQVYSALLDRQLASAVSKNMLANIVEDGRLLLDIFGPKCMIALNVSEADLRSSSMIGTLLEAIEGSPLKARHFSIEVSESVLINDYTGLALKVLKRLDAMGFAISLDDFGTGICSLTQLRDFPIRKVKIDRHLISKLAGDHKSRLMISAIVQMSHSLQLQVVAEGVETAEQEKFLRGIGCDYAQGFRYGKPATITALPALLAYGRQILTGEILAGNLSHDDERRLSRHAQ